MCPICSTPLEKQSPSSHQIYCSRPCADRAKSLRATAAKQRVCTRCGTNFIARSPAEIKRGGARYCTRTCAWAAKRGTPYKTLNEKFWPKVRLGRPDECWIWQGNTRANGGYGLLTLGSSKNQRHYRAHRISWELAHGPIPTGMHVCHRCDNPPCVNPKHLFLGTRYENMQDMLDKGRHRSNWPRKHGTINWNAKLTDEQVLLIRARYSAGGISQGQLAKEYGISQSVMSAIVSRRLWQHLP